MSRDATGGRRALPRSRPEWISFAVAVSILGFVIGLIVVQALGPDRPAAPVATREGPVRRVGVRYVVPVTVENHGDRAASNVQVLAELRVEGRTATGEQQIDFLAGHERATLEFAFDDKPDADAAELTVGVAAFAPG